MILCRNEPSGDRNRSKISIVNRTINEKRFVTNGRNIVLTKKFSEHRVPGSESKIMPLDGLGMQ